MLSVIYGLFLSLKWSVDTKPQATIRQDHEMEKSQI